jgi:hypothetical protein
MGLMGEFDEAVEAARRVLGGNTIAGAAVIAGNWSNGLVSVRHRSTAVVVKLFVDTARDEPMREWDSLTALAPSGVAPAPLALDLGDPPAVVMEKVRGRVRSFGELHDQDARRFAPVHRSLYRLVPKVRPGSYR